MGAICLKKKFARKFGSIVIVYTFAIQNKIT